MTQQSFIDATITAMSERKTSDATIARKIQQMDHANVANRIAMAYVALNNERAILKRANRTAAVKPEQMIGFTQNLMNMICWQARRLMLAQQRTESGIEAENMDFAKAHEEVRETGPTTNGVDFSQDIAAEVGVEGVSSKEIASVVADDYFLLGNVHSWLAGKMNYLAQIEDLMMYQDRAPETDSVTGEISWVVKATATDFNEALTIMSGVLEELQESEKVKVGTEAVNIDFTMGLADNQEVRTRPAEEPVEGTADAQETEAKELAQAQDEARFDYTCAATATAMEEIKRPNKREKDLIARLRAGEVSHEELYAAKTLYASSVEA